MRRLLFITYYFPPHGGAGVQRTLKFVKYLPDYGWQPIVLTVNPGHSSLLDPTLKADIPADIQLYRTPALRLSERLPWRFRNFMARWILIVDEQLGWLPYATSVGQRLIASSKPDAIFSTSAPYTAHLVAYRLATNWQLPWIADFRDPWIGNISLRVPTKLHAKFIALMESKIIAHADRVCVVTEPMRQAFLRRYPRIEPSNFLSIPNGYDPQDFDIIDNVDLDENKFIITYTGSFYSGSITPDVFLLSLKQLLEQQVILQEKLMVFFVGNIGKKVQHTITSLGLNKVVSLTGYQTHQKSIGYLVQSDLLLLIISNQPGSEVVMTGKVFEYLAAKKPILSISPPGVASDLIREAHVGVVVDPDDIVGIANQIEYFYRCWESGIVDYTPREEVIKRYDRHRLTGILAATLDNLTVINW